jgi:hypothetical protein
MGSQVSTKFVFIYDLTGTRMELGSYIQTARLCEGNAHVVTRTDISVEYVDVPHLQPMCMYECKLQ